MDCEGNGRQGGFKMILLNWRNSVKKYDEVEEVQYIKLPKE